MSDDVFVWIDMETTGLDPKQGVPLELGFIVTDLELKELNRNSWLIYERDWDMHGYYEEPRVEKFVADMHDKSGIWGEFALGEGQPLATVQVQAAEWLFDDIGVGAGGKQVDPMCGSSVQFDREWMREWFPAAFELFSYRNIDISTLKEIMRRLSPEIYDLLDNPQNGSPSTPVASKRGLHRVLPDLEDTISEFKFYRQEFLYVPADFA